MRNDQKDAKILELLKKNARIRNVDIAKEVELTEGAVRARIERMLNDGAILQFTIKSSEVNQQHAVIMAKAKHNTKKMMIEISKSNIADEAYEISGDFDAFLVISGATIDEIDKKIDKLRELKDVTDTRTYISLKKW
ncbi:MAG: Lrp/AsnC family transcriptional regulator [Candidatus Micrarchaeota archaeon]|nr:Lrp/AsnC family transcriptional regulator [Candidatus Micrarchaeota archaeon]